MKVFALLIVLAAAVSAEIDFRVSNGQNAKFGQVKCYTTLKIYFEDAIKTCGGCLISPTKVLTSGNCVTSLDEGTSNQITFAFGTSKVPKRGLGFDDITFADGYDPSTRNSTADLAIITLNNTVSTSMFRQPATPSTTATPDAYVGKKLFVCGYGNTDNEKKKPLTLQCTNLKVIKSSECIPADSSAASTTAAGDMTTAAGDSTTAAGDSTTAAGDTTTAAGDTTTAAGDTTTTAADTTTTAAAGRRIAAGFARAAAEATTTAAASSSSGGIICTRNVNDANVCHGDEGSPVFYKNGDNMEFVGVVSYFPDVRPNARCQDGHKVVVTQVGAYSSFLSS